MLGTSKNGGAVSLPDKKTAPAFGVPERLGYACLGTTSPCAVNLRRCKRFR